jgi:hypothetical protein
MKENEGRSEWKKMGLCMKFLHMIDNEASRTHVSCHVSDRAHASCLGSEMNGFK